jgi:hypothetical protein
MHEMLQLKPDTCLKSAIGDAQAQEALPVCL